ncbi:hypothetical protein AVDCRST_MAG81-1582 [uncultured Synechococcales cyanobacterium]|uniref:Uncharacterized protein n=1 Tax=uncultured Synechococcales cyanobacterium TaxID=1936017 RepID=A0A6J4V969_9CYAN|nr:hypothetical protein AVDCRST_MAG81-1582 [uncultured Synechococcales cyanobacterium]
MLLPVRCEYGHRLTSIIILYKQAMTCDARASLHRIAGFLLNFDGFAIISRKIGINAVSRSCGSDKGKGQKGKDSDLVD